MPKVLGLQLQYQPGSIKQDCCLKSSIMLAAPAADAGRTFSHCLLSVQRYQPARQVLLPFPCLQVLQGKGPLHLTQSWSSCALACTSCTDNTALHLIFLLLCM